MQNRRRMINAAEPATPDRVRTAMPWCVSRQYGRGHVVLCVAATKAPNPPSALALPLLSGGFVPNRTEQSVRDFFHDFARRTSDRLGSPWAFVAAIGVVVLWACLGPHFGFSDTWQLVINTGTTIVTFLMVFLIQNTQNRDQRALQLKLDELLRAVEGAREQMFAGIEERDEQRLEEVKEELRAECGMCASPEEHQLDPEHRGPRFAKST